MSAAYTSRSAGLPGASGEQRGRQAATDRRHLHSVAMHIRSDGAEVVGCEGVYSTNTFHTLLNS